MPLLGKEANKWSLNIWKDTPYCWSAETCKLNHSEILPHICQEHYYFSNKYDKLGQNVEKLEFLFTIDENVKLYTQCGKKYGGRHHKNIQNRTAT